MAALDDILRKLEAAKGDVQAQAVITADFALSVQPAREREQLTSALDAAAVLRWFDVPILAHMLEVDETETRQRFESLCLLPFVETFPVRGSDTRNIHDATRFGWRKRLAREQPIRWRELSSRAAAWFGGRDGTAARIEWVYHLLSADPDAGARCLEELGRQWTGVAHPEDNEALAQAVWELEASGLVEGVARVEVLLCAAETRSARGETAQLGDLAREAEALARSVDHPSVLARVGCLLGDVLQSQGKLEAAQAAFGEYLAISRRLAEQDPSNAGWQRDLAVAQIRVGAVLQAQGKLGATQAAFSESLAISRNLAEGYPNNVGWQRELAMAHSRVGDVLLAQGKLEAAQAAFGEYLALGRHLAEQDPSNSTWRHGLAVAYSRVGDVLQAQGQPGGGAGGVL
jgi:Flp pilus assembly protein TadD